MQNRKREHGPNAWATVFIFLSPSSSPPPPAPSSLHVLSILFSSFQPAILRVFQGLAMPCNSRVFLQNSRLVTTRFLILLQKVKVLTKAVITSREMDSKVVQLIDRRFQFSWSSEAFIFVENWKFWIQIMDLELIEKLIKIWVRWRFIECTIFQMTSKGQWFELRGRGNRLSLAFVFEKISGVV